MILLYVTVGYAREKYDRTTMKTTDDVVTSLPDLRSFALDEMPKGMTEILDRVLAGILPMAEPDRRTVTFSSSI